MPARPTTTIHSSSFTTTPISSQPSEYTVSSVHLLCTLDSVHKCTYKHQQNGTSFITNFTYIDSAAFQWRIPACPGSIHTGTANCPTSCNELAAWPASLLAVIVHIQLWLPVSNCIVLVSKIRVPSASLV